MKTRFIYIPPGTTMKVFDPKLWNNKDVGDNSQFWVLADIIELTGETATVRFHHDGRISKGHFINVMREVDG